MYLINKFINLIDRYLDQTQLALVCECIGMEKLSDEVSYPVFKNGYAILIEDIFFFYRSLHSYLIS